MPASEETGSGPVIHDHRRIDPVTGQVRGKHAAAKPAGTTGAALQAIPLNRGAVLSGNAYRASVVRGLTLVLWRVRIREKVVTERIPVYSYGG